MQDYKPHAWIFGDARDEARTEAARLYGQGCTIRSVAELLGRSPSSIRRLLLEAGVQLCGRGGAIRKAAA